MTIRCTLSQWEELSRFLDNGRIEIDPHTIERSIRPIALNHKNALFADLDGGTEHWTVIAPLNEACKLDNVEPPGYPGRSDDLRFWDSHGVANQIQR